MKVNDTYYVKRNDNYIWLRIGESPLETDEIIEERPILTSADGYDLIHISDNVNYGSSVWLRNGDTQDNYREEEHVEPEQTDEPILEV